jgi:hypothetical protein
MSTTGWKTIELAIVITVLMAASAAAQTNTFPSSGNVGIGTTIPSNKLSIYGDYNGTSDTWPADPATGQLVLHGATDSSLALGLGVDTTNNVIRVQGQVIGSGSLPISLNPNGGNVGIGTTAPGATLEVNGTAKIDGALTVGSSGIVFPDGTSQGTAFNTTLCGGDYAESVDVSGQREGYEPGDVLVIDPKAPGRFFKSSVPYSTIVAGVFSTKPGTVGRRQTTAKTPEEVPMAMVGIVPVKVTAGNGPIHTGDLLVTSSEAGYAMKGINREQMLGAVIGKALNSLESGKGVIEVLVTLQ